MPAEKRLCVISSAPAIPAGEGFEFDRKFLEGMRFYARGWDGPVTALMTRGEGRFPFGTVRRADELPFALGLVESDAPVTAAQLAGFDAVLASGDNHRFLHLAGPCREAGARLYYIIEYTIGTRLRILGLERGRSLPRKLYSALWMLNQERRRRAAFRAADGLQANGYPAAAAYGPLNANTLLYLDNRLGADLLATEEEMAARRARLAAPGPLRLIHSGRLEPMKGAQDLVPVAAGLARAGVDFTLEIFGAGSLEAEIREGAARAGLGDRLRLMGAVDFETELVPHARREADVFLSCHRQSDPSCTYLESMGCGLAVAGYANAMWSALAGRSGGGWVAPLGDAAAMARLLAGIAERRAEIAQRCAAARAFAGEHRFETEFSRRLAHLAGGRG